jgi:hypothetical protein
MTKSLRNLGALFRLTAYDPVVWQQVRLPSGTSQYYYSVLPALVYVLRSSEERSSTGAFGCRSMWVSSSCCFKRVNRSALVRQGAIESRVPQRKNPFLSSRVPQSTFWQSKYLKSTTRVYGTVRCLH